jgi:hypothetical protein
VHNSLAEPSPEQPAAPRPHGPEPIGPGPSKSRRLTLWIALGAAALGTAAWQWSGSTFDGSGGAVSDGVRIIAARHYAAIRAPRIRRGRRTGGGSGSGFTLVAMAEPGSFVEAGTVVAEFDRQSQEETIERQRAGVVQAEASIDRRTADLMIEMEALKQQLVAAQGDFRKAELDLGTVTVRSAIEAQIL